jgi:hypothetical protein
MYFYKQTNLNVVVMFYQWLTHSDKIFAQTWTDIHKCDLILRTVNTGTQFSFTVV